MCVMRKYFCVIVSFLSVTEGISYWLLNSIMLLHPTHNFLNMHAIIKLNLINNKIQAVSCYVDTKHIEDDKFSHKTKQQLEMHVDMVGIVPDSWKVHDSTIIFSLLVLTMVLGARLHRPSLLTFSDMCEFLAGMLTMEIHEKVGISQEGEELKLSTLNTKWQTEKWWQMLNVHRHTTESTHIR